MSRRRLRVWVLMVTALLVAPASARGQLTMAALSGQATAHVGTALGNGEAGNALAVGASLAVLEHSGWGAEFDFGYADSGDDDGGGLDAQSYMLSVIGAWPKGKLRPFGLAGIGAIRARTCVAGCGAVETWTDFGLTGGGGIQFLFSDALGVRADARYFTALGDHSDDVRPGLSYWRIAAGVTYLWSIAP